MRKFTIFLAAVCAFCACAMGQNNNSSGGNSGNLSQTIDQVGSQYAAAYLQPFENAFGADLNSGFYHTADVGSNGFHFSLSILAGAATVPSSDQTINNFQFASTYKYTDASGTTTVNDTFSVRNGSPTIFGDQNTKGEAYARIHGFDKAGLPFDFIDSIQTISGLVNTSIAPLPIVQLGLGTIMGTDATIRFLPAVKLGNFGSLGLWGIGIRHSISQYLYPMGDAPFNLTVGLAFQGFYVNDSSGNSLIKNSAHMFNAEISKSWSILTVYGGLQSEGSTMDVS
jgi:hypothetical protein